MGARLPFEYQEVEWIEATGTQYIDTGYIPNYNMKIEVVASTEDATHGKALFGARTAAKENGYIVLFEPQVSYSPQIAFGLYWSDPWNNTSFGIDLGEKYTITFDKDYFTMNEKSKATSGRNTTPNVALVLFANRDGTTINSYFYGKIYYTKISESGEVVREYIPCYRKSDGVAGMYCIVTDTFFPNLGTGEFEVGADVNHVDRTFQSGTVGSTNVIEGRYIADGMDQLVNYTMLYDYGDECVDITGGWTKTSLYGNSAYDGSATKNSDNLYLYANSETSTAETVNLFGCITTNSMIDSTEYKEIGIVCTQRINAYSWAGRVACGISATKYMPSGIGELDLTDDKVTYTDKIMRIGGYVSFHSDDSSKYNLEGSSNRNGYLTVFQCYAGNSNVYNLFLLKADDWSTLCEKAGVTASTILEAVAHAETILSNASAVSFMVRKCTGDFMGHAISNESFMTALESSPYKNKVYANPHWAKFLAMVA